MTEKEIAEIRRRFRNGKNSITHVRGCYVNEKKEIAAELNESLTLMTEEESEKVLTTLKKTLSGSLSKNLIDISFTTQQVVDSPEHKLLMTLRNSGLSDEAALQEFYQKVIEAVKLEGEYLILLAKDSYDVPYRTKDGATLEDSSTEVFTYILCSICPVKMTKPALSYYVYENKFSNRKLDWLVSPPELGFMFPSFDDRSTNIYSALYYTHSIKDNQPEFVQSIFNSEIIPMPAAEQQETFQAILGNSLEDDCSYGVVQAVHSELCQMIELHKASKEEEPLVLSKNAVKQVLQHCGVSQEKVEAFDEKYNSEFGEETPLNPRNIVNSKRFEVSTPNVSIKVHPDYSDMIETRIIDGVKYIMIRAGDDVQVNGVSINITD
ncbi:MAG: DUF4317 domain-containing protein [Oscillospiraceae bacterium]|nr:DUF4317 domain-containing protein [Oscillospiraceae bacterium]